MTDGSGVVRIGSRVSIRDVDGDVTFRIVEPENADALADRVSALSPLGSALLGSRVGDRVLFRAPVGLLAVLVTDASTPAAGEEVQP
jgi:transcription elongation GreA/GreB family factor